MAKWTKREIRILRKQYIKIKDLDRLVIDLGHSKSAIINKAYELKIKRDKKLLRKNRGEVLKKIWADPTSIYNSNGYRGKLSLGNRGYQTKQTIDKISKSKKGKPCSEVTKNKLRKFYLGKTYEEIHGEEKAKEIKKKIREAKSKSYEEIYGDRADSEKEKRRKTHIELWKNEEYAKKRFKVWKMRPTLPERIMIDLIKRNNLPIEYVGDGKFWIDGFNPDFIFKNDKKIIEVFGDYWHNRHNNKGRDKRRFLAYKKDGYNTLIIWEHELVNKKEYGIRLSEEEIINKVNNLIPQT